MKLIFFSNTAENLINFRRNLILNYINKNHEIFLIFQKKDSNKIYYNFFANKGCKINEIYMDRHSLNPIKELITFFQIFKLYNKIKPEMAFHFTIKPNIYGSLIANLKKINSINNITGLGYFFFVKGLIKFFLFFLYKVSIKKSNHTFFQNKEDAEFFLKNKLILRNKYSIIPGSGVDLNFFKFCDYPKNKINKFLFVGRLIKEKGINEYLNAAIKFNKYNYKAKFYIIGSIDDNNKSNISIKLIRELHNKKIINYLGKKNDIRPILKKIDAVVLPSYREGLSHSLLETCSMGRPIISTRISGNKDLLIDNYNGFSCEPRSVSSLISAINKFIKLNYKKKQALGINARILVKTKFDEKIVIDKYNYFFEKF